MENSFYLPYKMKLSSISMRRWETVVRAIAFNNKKIWNCHSFSRSTQKTEYNT